MILLDTNVISEIMRPVPEPSVISWLSRQPREDLSLCAVTVAEIRYGILRLPAGKRRNALWTAFDALLADTFLCEALPFHVETAEIFARLKAGRYSAGYNDATMDLMIAAIALTHNATLATRNTRDFEGFGVELVNPWLET